MVDEIATGVDKVMLNEGKCGLKTDNIVVTAMCEKLERGRKIEYSNYAAVLNIQCQNRRDHNINKVLMLLKVKIAHPSCRHHSV